MVKKKANKYSDKIEQLMKGSFQRRTPFNPNYDITFEDATKINDWQEYSDSTDRQEIPEMPIHAKTRALHKLHGLTDTKKHPKTGERMFLLHRGVGEGEFNSFHQNHTKYDESMPKSSWTPHYHIANDMAVTAANEWNDVKISNGDHDQANAKPRTISAWIPESKIHNIPNQSIGGDGNTYEDEHEVIISHSPKDIFYHENNFNPKSFGNPQNTDQAINARSTTSAPSVINSNYRKVLQQRMKMRKSEEFAKYESKLKSFRNAAAGLATAASMAMAPTANAKMDDSPTPTPSTITQQTQASKPAFDPTVRKTNILRSIAQVESSGGKNTNHAPLPKNSIHRGESAVGSYGLTPLLIRETARLNKDLLEKHPNLHKLKGAEMKEYISRNPQLEQEVAGRHYDRLSQHFGHDPNKIGYAWLNGITGTKKALKRGADLQNHWHVQKINKALQKIRTKNDQAR